MIIAIVGINKPDIILCLLSKVPISPINKLKRRPKINAKIATIAYNRTLDIVIKTGIKTTEITKFPTMEINKANQ